MPAVRSTLLLEARALRCGAMFGICVLLQLHVVDSWSSCCIHESKKITDLGIGPEPSTHKHAFITMATHAKAAAYSMQQDTPMPSCVTTQRAVLRSYDDCQQQISCYI